MSSNRQKYIIKWTRCLFPQNKSFVILFVFYQGILYQFHIVIDVQYETSIYSSKNSNSIKLLVIGKVAEYRIQLKVPIFYARFWSLGIYGFCCGRLLGLSKFLPDDNRRRQNFLLRPNSSQNVKYPYISVATSYGRRN